MKMAITGICLNILYTLLLFVIASEPLDPDAGMYRFMAWASVILNMISVYGLSIFQKNKSRSATLVFFGSLFFVPLGLVAILGIKKAVSTSVEKNANEELARRRQILSERKIDSNLSS